MLKFQQIVAIACVLTALPVSPAVGRDSRILSENRIIRFYQDHISGADGSRCPMYPSCSEYAARALKKHGPVMGWIMACDRILRCGRNEVSLAPEKKINGRTHAYDPVSANDFWWFEEP
jgi:uncharacterized protein